MSKEDLIGSVKNAGENITTSFMQTYFANHGAAIKAKADENAKEFLGILNHDIASLGEEIAEHKSIVEENLRSPEFAKILEQAIKVSSLTGNTSKKELLSSILANRLFAKSETTEALLLKLACEKVEDMNSDQLLILAYIQKVLTTEGDLQFTSTAHRFTPEEYIIKLLERFKPYYKLVVKQIDMSHLEMLGCIRFEYSVTTYLDSKIAPSYFIADKGHYKFYQTKLGLQLVKDWTDNLQYAHQTPLGLVIAEHVNAIISTKSPN